MKERIPRDVARGSYDPQLKKSCAPASIPTVTEAKASVFQRLAVIAVVITIELLFISTGYRLHTKTCLAPGLDGKK